MNLIALQAEGIATAVAALVMLLDDSADHVHTLDLGDDVPASGRMVLNHFPLLIGETIRSNQHLARDVHLADVVHIRADDQRSAGFLVQLHITRDDLAAVDHALGVAVGVVVTHVDDADQALDGQQRVAHLVVQIFELIEHVAIALHAVLAQILRAIERHVRARNHLVVGRILVGHHRNAG